MAPSTTTATSSASRCCLCGIDSDFKFPLVAAVNVEALMVDNACSVEITQVFQNNSNEIVAAMYLFPIDDAAAVCEFQAQIGDRVVIGEVKEKTQAEKEYKEALEQGHAASLLSEIKDDIFRLDIGNVQGGETVSIKICYVTELKAEGESVRFFIPTCVMPRYSPANSESIPDGPCSMDKDDLNLTLNVRMRSNIVDITSPTDAINWQRNEEDGRAASVGLVSGRRGEQKGDLVILVSCENPHQPRVCVEEHAEGDTYAALLTLCPQFSLDDCKSEIVFVVDRSGSMDGSQIQQAREALELFLRSLPQDCYFNIVGFGSNYETLFPKSQKYSPESLKTASEHAQNVRADLGGTELMGPLKAIESFADIDGYTRQVFILTDGEVSNTEQVIGQAQSMSRKCRIFCLGIGSGVSHHLVEGMARAGKGTACFVSSGERMQTKVISQLKDALQPSLSKVSIDWGVGNQDLLGAAQNLLGFHKKDEIQQGPAIPPPVFSGTIFSMHAIFPKKMGIPPKIVVLAESPEGPLRAEIVVSPEDVTHGVVIHRLAARCLIRDLEEGTATTRRGTADVVKDEIVKLGTQHSLASRHTSFIAIDRSTKIPLEHLQQKEKQLHNFRDAECDENLRQLQQSLSMLKQISCSIQDELQCQSAMIERIDCCNDSLSESLATRLSRRSRAAVSNVASGIGNVFSGLKSAIGGKSASTNFNYYKNSAEDSPAIDLDGEEECNMKKCDAAPKPAAAAAASVCIKRNAQQLLSQIIRLQAFDGSFGCTEELAQIVGISSKAVIESSCADGTDLIVWSTAIAIAFIRGALAEFREEWELLEKKAVSFVSKSTSIIGAEDLISAAIQTHPCLSSY